MTDEEWSEIIREYQEPIIILPTTLREVTKDLNGIDFSEFMRSIYYYFDTGRIPKNLSSAVVSTLYSVKPHLQKSKELNDQYLEPRF